MLYGLSFQDLSQGVFRHFNYFDDFLSFVRQLRVHKDKVRVFKKCFCIFISARQRYANLCLIEPS